jgi:hypothetical protein
MLTEYNQPFSCLGNVSDLPGSCNEHFDWTLVSTVEDKWATFSLVEVFVVDEVSHAEFVSRDTPMIDPS